MTKKQRFVNKLNYLNKKALSLNNVYEAILLFVQVCTTLGTTGACSFDNLKEIGPICEYMKFIINETL